MQGTLTVRRARLVLRDRVVVGDLRIEGGVIVAIGPRLPVASAEEIDADGRVLLPGLVDLDWQLDRVDELGPRSRAVVRGGVTTVIAVAAAETPEALRAEHDAAGEVSSVHLGLWQRATGTRSPLCERARGWYVGGELLHDPRVEPLFADAGRLVVVEPVDPARVRARSTMYGDPPALADHALIHDVDSAVAATRRVMELARKYGTTTHVAFVGSAEELLVLAERPARMTAGVRLHNLLLDEDAAATLAERAVTEPPLRKARHVEASWEALRAEVLQVVSSGDRHVTAARKSAPYPSTPVNGPAAEWCLPLLAGTVAAGRWTWPELARAACEQPARLAGLTRKGRLEVGWDADLVLLDPERGQEIATAHNPAGWSTFAGLPTGGRVDLTVVGGRVVLREDEVVGHQRGSLV